MNFPPIARSLRSAEWIRTSWQWLARLPGGRQAYSRLLGAVIPYTATIRAEVLELAPGFARVRLPYRRRIRNHLNSVHAMALANLAELTGNAALAYSLPARSRFIVTRFEIDYVKKARGAIEARCRCPVPETNERQSYVLSIELFDPDGQKVAHAHLTTLVGPS